MFKKIGEDLTFSKSDILAPKKALGDEKILRRFVKMAKKLRRIAPKASDFLYFHSIMMHSAEAALINQETGEPILNKSGKESKGWFEDFKNDKGQDSVKWISPDGIQPYKNANGDIFGETHLVKAYKNWIGRPLCRDHQSDSIDGIRGIIVDVYYDPKYKRVHALAALDRKNYGDLARKVEAGYANSVSMGTGVGRSICTECGNVAFTERDYCPCVKTRKNYGEINLDLSPIELSLVVNGADGLAKIKQIVASMNQYAGQKQERINQLVNDRCVNPTELQSLTDSLSDMQKRISALMGTNSVPKKTASSDLGELVAAYKALSAAPGSESAAQAVLDQIKAVVEPKMKEVEPEALPPTGSKVDYESGPVSTTPSPHSVPDWIGSATEMAVNPANRLASVKEDRKIYRDLVSLRAEVKSLSDKLQAVAVLNKKLNHGELRKRAMSRRAYWFNGKQTK